MAEEEVQDLKRENFNLKLRIYFLEEQNQPSGNQNEYSTQTTYVHQLQNEIEQLRRRLFSQSTQQSDGPQTLYNFDYDDERRAFREELEKYRRDNEQLRQTLQKYKIQSDSRPGRNLLTTTSSSIDSALDQTTAGMSSTFLNSNSFQVELNESKERERKLQEQIYSLQQQVDSSILKLNDLNRTLADLDRARRQIQQYEIQIQNYQQQQSKAERVLQRLQSEYEAQIARLVEQQQGQTADYEKHRLEPLIARIRFTYPVQDRANPNINIDEYQQALDNRDRIIEQLEEAISEVTTRLNTPFTLMLPPDSNSTGWQDEKSQNLIRDLNTQTQRHLETIEQLRAECIELRQGEKHLRNQVDGLTHLINTPVRNPELPPLPPPSTSTSKVTENIENAQQLDALQTAVVQITLQLRSDAENVSGLTNRVAQILRDRDEWQYKINRLQSELEEKNTRIHQLEKRDRGYESQDLQQYSIQIETLQREIKNLQDELKDRNRVINEIRTQTQKDYEKFNNIHNQEKQNLQGQIQAAEQLRIDLQRQLENERRRYEDFQRTHEKTTFSTDNQFEQMEQEIQQQRRQIETFSSQIREMENNFLNERHQLERERDFEKEKSFEIQNTFNTTNRRFSELQAEFDRIKGHSSDELQNLRRENQTLKDNLRTTENKLFDLTQRNEQFKSQVSVYEHRFQDNEDSDRRTRQENMKLQRDLQEILRENENLTREMHEMKRKYEIIKTDMNNTQYKIDKIELENKTFDQENAQLKRTLDELSVRIREQIESEYEEEYRQLTAHTESEIHNIEKERQAIRYDLEQSNSEKQRLSDQLQTIEYNLKQANQTLKDYENDIKRLEQIANASQERNEQIEREITRTYTNELQMKTDRLQDLETKYRSFEIQFNQNEKILHDLRQENGKLLEHKDRLQREFDQYRHEQQIHVDDVEKEISTMYEERIRREVLVAIEDKQKLIAELENQLREQENLIKKLQHDLSSSEPKDLRLELDIRIEQLEEEIHRQEHSIETFSQTLREKDQQIDKLRDQIQETDNNNTNRLEILQEELQKRDRRIEQITHDKKYDVSGFERHISELQGVIRDQEREITDKNNKLHKIERDLDVQQRELKDYRQKIENLNINLNVAIEQNEGYLERIKLLEKQLEATSKPNISSEQILHLQTVIEDLTAQLRQREDSLKGLQRTIADCDSELKETRHIYDTLQSDYNRMQLRHEQMDKQYKADLETRDQTINSLRNKLAEKDQGSKNGVLGALVSTDQSWKTEIQQRDDVIEELKRKLEQARKSKSPVGQTSSSGYEYARRITIQPRPNSQNLSKLNRDELLYELEMTLQLNDELTQQLAQKSPNITELHNQITVIRKELARQKYVNQVLWRKLDALSDIYGSNTRAELADELVNYQNEIEVLKSKQIGTNKIYVSVPNLSSKTSSETSQHKKDTIPDNTVDNARYTLIQRQIDDKDEQIRQLRIQLNDIKKTHENELNQYQQKYERIRIELTDNQNGKQNDQLKATQRLLEQAQDQNQRLHHEIKLLQNELTNKKELIAHYDKQISLLEKQMSSRDHGKGEMTVGTSEMSGLLEEMRHLRQDLERSVNRQNELQIKIDENIRLSRAPREFTFSGRGVSYPDLRLIDASASVNSSENYIITSMSEEKRSRPLGSSTIEFENEQINREKLYAIGEVENHENLRRLIIDIQKQLNAIENKIQEKLRSKSITSTTEPSIEWLEHRLHSLKQCLTLLERIYQIIETYRTTHLPSKINSDERIHNENQELRLSLSKCSQDFQRLKQKYKDQTIHLEQVLAQLTKANYKKTNTDDYLALLLRPTLNNLQKARSNMEHHLKESNNMNYISQKTMQSHRTNHFD